MATTNHLGITLVEQAQAQKEVTVNQALTRLDALLNTGAKSRTTATPPGSPLSGDLYIVGNSPTGAWSGQAGKLAYFDQIWRFIAPNEGATLWVNDEDAVYTYNGASWIANPAADVSGFVNKFRNGTFDIWQRGASGTITAGTPAYTADGWVAGSSGANVTWARAAGRALTAHSLKITGATSVSDTFFKQTMESFLCYPLAGRSVVFQAQLFNSTGAAITPTITVKHAGAVDNWSSPVTDITGQLLQTCPDGVWTPLFYVFTAHASAGNGLEIIVDVGGALNSGSKFIQIAEADVRPGAIVQSPELRHIAGELALCQRYLPAYSSTASGPQIVASAIAASSTVASCLIPFPVMPRVNPSSVATSGTFTLYDAGSHTTVTGFSLTNTCSPFGGSVNATVASGLTTGRGVQLFSNASNSYIMFMGAEL